MKKILLFCFIVLCSNISVAQEQNSDEQQLRHLKKVLWPKAYRENDPKLLGRILHESFQFVQNSGEVDNKQDSLDYVADKDNKWQNKQFDYQIERLEIFKGAFAVISGTGRGETFAGKKYEYKSSNHLIKKDGRWQAVSSHVSAYKEIK